MIFHCICEILNVTTATKEWIWQRKVFYNILCLYHGDDCSQIRLCYNHSSGIITEIIRSEWFYVFKNKSVVYAIPISSPFLALK